MIAARRSRFVVAALAATAMTAVLATATASPSQGAPLAPPYPAPVMTGYVPLDADATRQTLANASLGNAGTELDFTVGITNAGAGALMFYDHWEDGYEADLTNPVQSSTSVWGDGNPANGDASTYCGVRCAGDLLPAGAVFSLRNLVPTPRTTTILWDGRDRISSTRGFAITAGGFTTSLGSVLSASASAYDTTKWGTDYWVPVGEDMVAPTGTSDAFASTNLQVMADQPGTVVEIDRDGDGTVDITQTIGAGEVAFVSGGVNRGAHVRSSKPVQAHVGAGDTTANYEVRWFTLSPTSLLSADYLNPVGSRRADGVDNQRTITYLFNPNDTAITVVPTCTGCSGSIAVPAGGGASYASPLDVAVRFVNVAGEPFVAVGAVGSESGAAPGTGPDGSQSFDWGFGLVPTRLLTPKAVLGWAPGNSRNPPSSAPVGNYDDDPVWISALRDTTLYIDYDGDPTTGALTGGCQGNYDETRAVAALESVRVFDALDADMTGASIYTCDNTLIAGAWGQDPQNAPAGTPGFDAGYALIPSTTMVVDKTSGMALDVNGDGRFGPGDRIAYEISIADAGSVPFINVQAVDALPSGTSYVAGSTTITNGDGPAIPFADDVTPPATTAYPLDEDGAAMPTILSGTTLTIRYEVEIDNPFPAGTAISNSVTVFGSEDGGGEVGGGNADVIELVAADLSLTKTLTSAPSYVGEPATFLVTVHNDGPDAAGDVVVRDLLPAELGLLSAAPSDGSYDSETGLWSVGAIPAGQSRTLSITATVHAPTATNRAEVVASGAADPDSTPGNGVPGEDDQAEVTVTTTGAALGDSVFLDLDGDGVQGPGEPGLGGVRVVLTRIGGDASETELGTTTTSGTGSYRFGDLPAGTYRVEAVAPPGSDPTTPTRVDVTLAAGESIDTVDFGVAPPPAATAGSIGDTVWNDADADGVHDAGEPGLAGATVTLRADLDGDGTYESTLTAQTTGSNGSYRFDNLPPGRYLVTASAPGRAPTTPAARAVLLAAGESIDTVDFGFADRQPAPASIGDLAWLDTDGDGLRDPGEPGLDGVTLTLRSDPDGDGVFDTTVATTTSGPDGAYRFSDLAAGRYRVVAGAAGFEPTTPAAITVEVAAGEVLDSIDFGFTDAAVPTGSIGDRVWLDVDGDGAQGADEPGVNAVTVVVSSDPDGDGHFDTVVATTVTAGDGNYLVSGLPPGNYLVTVQVPDGLAVTGRAAPVQLLAGASVDTADIGLARVPAAPFDIRLDKRADGVATVGSTLRWVITVTNASATATGPDVVVTDVLPTGLEHVSAGAAGWSCTATSGTVVCTHPEPIAPGQALELVVVTRVTGGPGPITNQASVAAAGVEYTTENNAASAAAEVLPPSDSAPDPAPSTPESPSTVPSPSSLPTTGGDVRGIALVALATLLTGVVLVRRRRRPAT